MKEKINTSPSVEQMLMLEKVQSQLYLNHDNRFKKNLGIIHQIKLDKLHRPEYKEGIKAEMYQNQKKTSSGLKKTMM